MTRLSSTLYNNLIQGKEGKGLKRNTRHAYWSLDDKRSRIKLLQAKFLSIQRVIIKSSGDIFIPLSFADESYFPSDDPLLWTGHWMMLLNSAWGLPPLRVELCDPKISFHTKFVSLSRALLTWLLCNCLLEYSWIKVCPVFRWSQEISRFRSKHRPEGNSGNIWYIKGSCLSLFVMGMHWNNMMTMITIVMPMNQMWWDEKEWEGWLETWRMGGCIVMRDAVDTMRMIGTMGLKGRILC